MAQIACQTSNPPREALRQALRHLDVGARVADEASVSGVGVNEACPRRAALAVARRSVVSAITPPPRQAGGGGYAGSARWLVALSPP